MKTYAAYWNSDVRNSSASGAIFPAVAKYIIDVKLGYVCGCVLEDMKPMHKVTNQWEDILKMSDSKYVQSSVNDCFKVIANLLRNGEYVLFSGTSCQVKGLKSFLECAKVNDNSLLTMDFFCHGVPSPGVWDKYIQYYQEIKKRKVIGYRFRGKKYGWAGGGRAFKFCVKYVEYGKVKEDDSSLLAFSWYYIFFSNICLRPICHECSFATFKKPSDFTIGDFWGIDKVNASFNDGKGCSLIISRTPNSQAILNEIDFLEKIEVPLEKTIAMQKNAFNSCNPHPNRTKYFYDLNIYGMGYVLKKYFKYDLRHKITHRIKWVRFLMSWRK